MNNDTRYGKIKQVLRLLTWMLVAAGCVTLLVAAIRRQNHALCKGVRISIEGSGRWMVDSAELGAILTDQDSRQLVGTPSESISIRRLEKKIRSSPWVKKAELFFDSKQVLWVRVTERQPVARLFTDNGGSFYIDAEGARLPLKDYFPVKLPVFTSCPLYNKTWSAQDSLLAGQIGALSTYLVAHPFWMDMVEQVDVNANREFELVPAIGDDIVKLGDTSDLNGKFNRLMVFYKNVIPRVGWNKYAAVDVRFNGEVIGVKRDVKSQVIDTAAAAAMLKGLIAEGKTAMQDTVVRTTEIPRILVPNIDSSRDLTPLGAEFPGTNVTSAGALTKGHPWAKGHGVKPHTQTKALMPAKPSKHINNKKTT